MSINKCDQFILEIPIQERILNYLSEQIKNTSALKQYESALVWIQTK